MGCCQHGAICFFTRSVFTRYSLRVRLSSSVPSACIKNTKADRLEGRFAAARARERAAAGGFGTEGAVRANLPGFAGFLHHGGTAD